MRFKTLANPVARALLPLALLSAVAVAQAETLLYPVDQPMVAMELPDGWSVQGRDADRLSLHVTGEPEYGAMIVALPSSGDRVETREALGEALTAFTDTMGKMVGMADPQVGELSEYEGDDGMIFAGLRVDGQIAGHDAVLLQQAFTTPSGAAYILLTYGTLAAHDRREADFELLLNSMTLASEDQLAADSDHMRQTQAQLTDAARAQLVDTFGVLGAPRTAVGEYFAAQGTLPPAGIFDISEAAGTYANAITHDDKGVITVTMRNAAPVDTQLRGKQFTVSVQIEKNADGADVVSGWRCAPLGDLDASLLPADCPGR